MADTIETMKNAREQLKRAMHKTASDLATADPRSGRIIEAADKFAKLNSGIEALDKAIARDSPVGAEADPS